MSINPHDLDYSKQIKSLKDKVPTFASFLIESDFEELEKVLINLRRHSFYVSGLEKMSSIRYVQRSLSRAIEDGQSFSQWQEVVRSTKKDIAKDISNLSNSRLETVFRTNLSQARQDGIVDAAKVMNRILIYNAVGDARTRPTHAALDGITLPASHQFWDQNRPPLDFNCRCSLISQLKGRVKSTTEAKVKRAVAKSKEAGRRSFAKNSTQDSTSIKKYFEKKADASSIKKKQVQQFIKDKKKELRPFAKKIIINLDEVKK